MRGRSLLTLVVATTVTVLVVGALFTGLPARLRTALFPPRPDAGQVAVVDAAVRLTPTADGTRVRLVLTPTRDSPSRRLYLAATSTDTDYSVRGGGSEPAPTGGVVERTQLAVGGRPAPRTRDEFDRDRGEVYGPIDTGRHPVVVTFSVPAVAGRRIVLPLPLNARLQVRQVRLQAPPGTVTSCLQRAPAATVASTPLVTACDADEVLQGWVRLELSGG